MIVILRDESLFIMFVFGGFFSHILYRLKKKNLGLSQNLGSVGQPMIQFFLAVNIYLVLKRIYAILFF